MREMTRVNALTRQITTKMAFGIVKMRAVPDIPIVKKTHHRHKKMPGRAPVFPIVPMANAILTMVAVALVSVMRAKPATSKTNAFPKKLVLIPVHRRGPFVARCVVKIVALAVKVKCAKRVLV